MKNVLLLSDARTHTVSDDASADQCYYRPISILSQFSKVLEKLFNLRLEQFVISNEILSNCQYGFRPRMSTVHAALEIIESISTAIYYIKLQRPFVCLCVCTPPPPFFRHDRRNATKFGTHIRIDMGLILS